jgi:hypothetical protein
VDCTLAQSASSIPPIATAIHTTKSIRADHHVLQGVAAWQRQRGHLGWRRADRREHLYEGKPQGKTEGIVEVERDSKGNITGVRVKSVLSGAAEASETGGTVSDGPGEKKGYTEKVDREVRLGRHGRNSEPEVDGRDVL